MRCQTVIVYLLVVLFGASSWLSVNTIWVELPILVDFLPESWNLPSYLAVIVQITNIGPLFYTILKKCTKLNLHPAPWILVLLLFDIICHIFLAIFWQKTVPIGGKEHSVGLFIIFCGMSFVACLSDVIFIPYMAMLQSEYITAFFIGVSFSALIPTIVALIQGAGSINCVRNSSNYSNGSVYGVPVEPLFDFQIFNIIMTMCLCVSLIAFIILHWQNGRKRKIVITDASLNEEIEKTQISPNNNFTTKNYVFILICAMWVSALMNGVIPQVQSYAAIPYGQSTYHLAVTLANIAHPIGSFLPIFMVISSIFGLTIVTAMGTIVTAYIVLLAALSPEPFLVDFASGRALRILASILAVLFLAYLRALMATILRRAPGNSENRLFWFGVFSQIGSFVGTMIMFPLVSIYQIFKSAPSC